MRSIDPAGKKGEPTLFSHGRKILGEVDARREEQRLNQIYRTVRVGDGTISVSSHYEVKRISTSLEFPKLGTECTIYLESGRLSLLDGVDDPYTPAQLDFSSDLSIVAAFKAMGTMISSSSFSIPVTPTVKTCSGIVRSVDQWGLSGAVVVSGESRVVTCPVCERLW